MIYVNNITIPANTVASSPTLERLKVITGLVYKVEFMFPPGCSGLAHVVVNDGGYQVWPSTPDTDFACDDYTIEFEDTYLKTVAPLEFQIYGYNEDETYAHTIQVRIGMVDQDIFIARFLPTYGYGELMQLMTKLEKQEEERRQQALKEPFSWLFTEV